ncbi:cytochrome c oxidase subunit 3 family protein, partial [Pseudomonas aeruginosa]
MWFFILAELSVFSLLLLAFAGAQAWQPELFRAGREQLDSRWGLLLTVALLSSGWLAAQAVHAVALLSSGWLAAQAVHAVR